MLISIIIPAYNSEKTIGHCLQAMTEAFKRIPETEGEIIVVDDGSSDRTGDLAAAFRCRIIRQIHKGAAAARNAGARIARGEYLLFVDSDTIFYEDTLLRICRHLLTGRVDYISVRYSRKPLNDGWVQRYKALADYLYYYDFIFSRNQKESAIKNQTIGGGVEGYQAALFRELGGFDEKIRGAGIERETFLARASARARMISDGRIKTGHYFPGFSKLTRDYFLRTFHVMKLRIRSEYKHPYLERNAGRILIGACCALLPVMLLLQIPDGSFRAETLCLWLGVLWAYLLLHVRLLSLSFGMYGGTFTLYAVGMSWYCSSLIAAAGFLGFLRYTLLPGYRRE